MNEDLSDLPNHFYKLDESHNLVKCSVDEFIEWTEAGGADVAREVIQIADAVVEVVTTCLGFNMNWEKPYEPPMFFTTRVEGGTDTVKINLTKDSDSWDAAMRAQVVAVATCRKVAGYAS